MSRCVWHLEINIRIGYWHMSLKVRKLRFARMGLPYRVLNGKISVLSIFTGKQSPRFLRTALRFASGCTSQIRALFSRKDRQNRYYPVKKIYTLSSLLFFYVLVVVILGKTYYTWITHNSATRHHRNPPSSTQLK